IVHSRSHSVPSRRSSDLTGVDGSQEEAQKMASGAVYVFRRQDDGTWTQEAYVKASNTASMASFGSSVALSGDTLAVGARNEASKIGRARLNSSHVKISYA